MKIGQILSDHFGERVRLCEPRLVTSDDDDIECDRHGEHCQTEQTATESVHVPAGWRNDQMYDLLQFEAGQMYIANQIVLRSVAGGVQPVEVFSDDEHPNCWHEVYSDGSLWVVNDGSVDGMVEDEVWSDYRDYIAERLDCVPEHYRIGMDTKLFEYRRAREESDT